MIFVDTEKGRTTNFYSPFSFVAVFVSGIRDGQNQDPVSRINIPDPQHCRGPLQCCAYSQPKRSYLFLLLHHINFTQLLIYFLSFLFSFTHAWLRILIRGSLPAADFSEANANSDTDPYLSVPKQAQFV